MGSCTKRRFLRSEQWSQHGSQTLGWGVGGGESDRQISTVYGLYQKGGCALSCTPNLPGHGGAGLLTG